MDGLDVDLVEWCGLEPIPIDKHDDVWSDVDPLNLMLTCIANVSIESKEGPEIPLYSDVFYKFISNISKKIETNYIENKTLTKLRDTLLPKLLSGEIRVKDAEREVEAAV